MNAEMTQDIANKNHAKNHLKNHINLARKYRPQNLSELKGQDVLVRTISNAIKTNRIAQSYLLTGIRGVGKTTTARIIAKTVNCTNLIDHITPCGECQNCTGFADSSHPDIMEMDAASRTGVDDVRIIIENAEYKPMMGKYKVFIVDEVHMLSKNAFNALLKLLEEPPSHCIFIFATTETHKIPLTIISRCQRFDLARISQGTLKTLLENICTKEAVEASEDALNIIAIKGDGSARDSLSLLDQAIINSNGEPISKEIVDKMTSSVDHRVIADFLNSITECDSAGCIKLLEKFYQTNSDFHVFLHSFLSLTSYIAKKQAYAEYKSAEFYSIESEINEIAKKIDQAFLQICWRLAFNALSDLKISINQLQNTEMLALKLIYVLSANANSSSAGGIEGHRGGLARGDQVVQANQAVQVAQVAQVAEANSQKKTEELGAIASSNSASNNSPLSLSEERGAFAAGEPEGGAIHQSEDQRKNPKKFHFEQFIKYLANEKEMEAFYTLFNKSELISAENDKVSLSLLSPNKEFERSIREKASIWAEREVAFNFSYKEEISSYKAKKTAEALELPSIQKLSKNFPSFKINDILVSEK